MIKKLIITILLINSISFFLKGNANFVRSQEFDNFETLFNYSYKCFVQNLPFDSVCEILYDTIKNHSFFYVETEEVLSEDSNSFSFVFRKTRPNLKINYHYKLHNLHVVLINRYDSVFVNGNLYSNPDNYKIKLKEYFLNPNDKEYLPEKFIDSIEYFGEVLVTKSFVFFDTQMKPDSLNRKTSCEKLFEMVGQTIFSMKEIRNEASLHKWKIPYEELKISQKAAINKKHPLRIRIYFDYKVPEIPPPPPEYQEYNFDKIENSFDSLMQERIKKN